MGAGLTSGTSWCRRTWARTFRRLIEVERDHAGQGRESALQAARDFFYKGEIAEEIVNFVQSEGGFLTMEDMAEFSVGVDVPPSVDYKGDPGLRLRSRGARGR